MGMSLPEGSLGPGLDGIMPFSMDPAAMGSGERILPCAESNRWHSGGRQPPLSMDSVAVSRAELVVLSQGHMGALLCHSRGGVAWCRSAGARVTVWYGVRAPCMLCSTGSWQQDGLQHSPWAQL